MRSHTLELMVTAVFAIAVLHTFLASRFRALGARYREGSVAENFFHLLGEVEIVFGFWAGVLLLLLATVNGVHSSIAYAEGLSFTEPLFVFAILTVAATRPVIELASAAIRGAARLVPLRGESAVFFSCLVLGPLLGSAITEPAAMAVTALLLRERYFERQVSQRFRYLTLATLFVNVSIGGVLTHFAAPPVLMVASKWGWGLKHMLFHFGWKAALATALNAGAAAYVLRKELRAMRRPDSRAASRTPWWLKLIHAAFLALVVATSHHPVIFMGVLLFFMGVVTITREFQSELELRQNLLVAFFLGGLIVLGTPQSWWLEPLLRRLDAFALFLGTTALTGVVDNAALTYLGSRVATITEASKYALVAGAVAGGGLTVIANAPNPAGYSILQDSFGKEGIKPSLLAAAALLPTLVGMTCLWLLP